MPLVAVEELARSLKLPGLEGARLQSFIKAGLGKMERFQTDEGGYSLWVGGKPEPFLTAFALWGLKQAPRRRAQGPATDVRRRHPLAARFADPRRQGRRRRSTTSWARWGAARSPSTCWPRWAARIPATPASCSRSKDKLPRFGTAFLARALAGTLGKRHASVTGLLDDLSRSIETTGALAMIHEPAGHDLGWYMSDDVRTTAIATDAFLDLRPEEPSLPKLVKGLFGQRRDGRWATTQDNLFGLVSLVHYVRSREEGDVSVEARLGDRTVLEGDLSGQAPHPARDGHARLRRTRRRRR